MDGGNMGFNGSTAVMYWYGTFEVELGGPEHWVGVMHDGSEDGRGAWTMCS